MSAHTALLESLTWDDLNAAFGAATVQRGRGYQRSGAVAQLAETGDGRLVAWVAGTQRYATVVETSGGKLRGRCTCPVGVNCKHAAAVVLARLEQLKQKKKTPLAPDDDPRLEQIARERIPDIAAWDDEDGDWDDDYGDEEEEGDEDWGDDGDEEEDALEDEAPRPARSANRARSAAAPARELTPADDRLREFLQQEPPSGLVSLLLELAASFPEVRQALEDRRQAASGDVKELVRAARKAIREAAGEPGWSNDWSGEGYLPDYSRVRDLLKLLLDRGAAADVVALGGELLEAGQQQVELSHDEGETADEIRACLDVVFAALPRSSKTPAEQILWTIDAEMGDDYELCAGAEGFWKETFPREAWNEVAQVLSDRLQRLKPKKGAADEFSHRYQRERLSDWLIEALEQAGREDEILPLCEQEAEATGAYTRLVRRLLEADRVEEAEAWIRRGVEATQKRLPGVAAELRAILRRVRERQGDWKAVAADKAQEFFHSPSVRSFRELLAAAEKAECREPVEAAARRYLETGAPPQSRPRKSKRETIAAWPLPDPETLVEDPPRYGHRGQPPFYETLIDLALAERDPATALRWYDEAKKKHRPLWGYDERIAEAVVEQHPDRSLEIWKKQAEREIARVSPSAYDRAAVSLRKIRRTLHALGRQEEWRAYVARLRDQHHRKRRLLETLDSLEGKPIVQL